jgi:PAS domain S-box-containing protein
MKVSKMNVKSFLNSNKTKTPKNIETSEENSFKNFIEYSPTPIFRVRKNGTLLYINQAFAKMLNYSSKYDLENNLVVNKKNWDSLLSLLQKNNRLENHTVELIEKEGKEISKKTDIRVVKDNDGKKTYLEGIIVGNSNNLSTEEILEKIKELKEKSRTSKIERNDSTQNQYLMNITNEIKTPINSIVGILSLIEQKSFNSDEELINFAHNARVSVDSILKTISDIPKVLKLDTSKMELTSSNLDEVTKTEAIELLGSEND